MRRCCGSRRAKIAEASKSAEFRVQVWIRGGLTEKIRETVCGSCRRGAICWETVFVLRAEPIR